MKYAVNNNDNTALLSFDWGAKTMFAAGSRGAPHASPNLLMYGLPHHVDTLQSTTLSSSASSSSSESDAELESSGMIIYI